MQETLFAIPDDELVERRSLIALSLVPGVGPGRIRSLMAYFGTAAEATHANERLLARVPGIGAHTAKAIRSFDEDEEVDQQLRMAESVGAELIAAWDDRFPRLLREIYDPPAFIWVRGSVASLSGKSIAVVGTRRATDYGRRVAADFAAELARHGYTIVSGLAYGVDASAHRGALEAGGASVAVLGSGVDRIYPSRHNSMARQIIDNGALISEYPLGAAPDAPNFPRRNRIISGLCVGTLVVEAFAEGGALITARLALEQNREVFSVPGPIHTPSVQGCHRLIQMGYAKLVTSVDDIRAELEEDIGESYPADGPVTGELPEDLNAAERKILDELSGDPLHLDTLCVRTGIDPSSALVYLLSLEFKGLVRQMAGKQFFRT